MQSLIVNSFAKSFESKVFFNQFDRNIGKIDSPI